MNSEKLGHPSPLLAHNHSPIDDKTLFVKLVVQCPPVECPSYVTPQPV